MLKLCTSCRQLVPANAFAEHKRRHRGRQKNGRNGSTRRYRKARTVALARDSHSCQRCGRTEEQLRLVGLALETHHLDDNSRNDEPTNLLTLCPDCHPR